MTPVFDDFAIGKAHDVDIRDADRLAGGRDAKKFTLMGAAQDVPADHPITLGKEILFVPMTIRKRRPEHLAIYVPALAPGRQAGWGIMIDDIGREEQPVGDDADRHAHVALAARGGEALGEVVEDREVQQRLPAEERQREAFRPDACTRCPR